MLEHTKHQVLKWKFLQHALRIREYINMCWLINHVNMHSFRSITEATEKIKKINKIGVEENDSNLVIFPGWGIWTAFWPGEGGIWTKIFQTFKCPGVARGWCSSFDLTGTLCRNYQLRFSMLGRRRYDNRKQRLTIHSFRSFIYSLPTQDWVLPEPRCFRIFELVHGVFRGPCLLIN